MWVARADACRALRDASTFAQSADWQGLPACADAAHNAAERLKTLAAMWDELNAKETT